MELQTDEGNFHALKILIAASLNGKSLGTKFVGSNERVLDYIQRNRLPVLTTDQGSKIFSPNTAASFLFAEAGKLGDATKVEEWLEWESCQFLPVVHRTVLASGGKLEESLLAALNKELQTLQGNLGNRARLLGANLSVADVVIWSTVFPLLHAAPVLKDVVAEYPKVMAWFESLEKNAAFRDAIHALFKNDSKAAIKASITAQPVPPSVASSTRKLLGSEKPTLSNAASVETGQEESLATAEEKDAAVEAWLHGKSKVAKPLVTKHPILPKEGKRNVLITSALPYVNNVPHLGNIIGCVLSADVYARFCRLRNYNTLYICGTDEYGTATETKAVEEGTTPQEICDKYNKLHTEIYEWFNIGFDFFGRTTTEQQTKIAQDIFWSLQENGYVLKDTVDQLQCQQCNRFLADRFVEGICPFCAYEDARGDQCDKCGKLINAAELRNPKCKMCSNTPVVKSTSHLFLDLPKLEPRLVEFLEGEFEKGIWTSNTKVITRSWIRDGLKPRCISRDLKWGTPVPLEGYTDKVFYVWYDAPIGYMSITANYTEEWEKWWKNPDQVTLYQFMAKDNIPFHSVIFPCSLLGTNSNWTMVNNLSATEYLNYEDTKFSKSRNVGVFGNNAKDTGIPADIWRFYLLFLRPESQDSSFSWSDFVMKNNSELLNNLGNFINRALMFVNNNFGAAVPAVTLTEEDKELLAQITRELKTYVNNLEKIRLRDGIRNLLSISRLGNQYMQANKPWVLVKGTEEEKLRAGSVVGLAANIACLLSVLIQPYMPEVSATIQQQLQAPPDCNVLTEEFVCFLPPGHKIGKPQPLFQKIESCRAAELKKQFAGVQEAPKAVSQKAPPKAGGQGAMAAPEVIARLMDQVTKQGLIVRELKAAKAEKSMISTEVSKLLELKQQLADAYGQVPAESNKKQKGGAKKDAGVPRAAAAPSAPAAAAAAESPEVVMMLTEQVSKQGTLVRDLKAAKADKAQVDAAVAKLLDLKRLLAVATGIDPEEAVGGKSRKKGKKK